MEDPVLEPKRERQKKGGHSQDGSNPCIAQMIDQTERSRFKYFKLNIKASQSQSQKS